MTRPLLAVSDLAIEIGDPPKRVVEDVGFTLEPGEIMGLVGESGSGKTMVCRSILRLLPSPTARIAAGSIRIDGAEVARLSEAEMRAVRGREVAMIFQNPASHLDPLMTVGRQVAEAVSVHRNLPPAAALEEARRLFEEVGIVDPARRIHAYPHELSGGMKQRVMIAAALACGPKLLIADEPTTALDVTVQAQILRLLRDIRDRTGLGILLVTHDLGVVAEICDTVGVMYRGRLVERGRCTDVFRAPAHRHTRDLLAAQPGLAVPPAPRSAEGEPRPLVEIDGLRVEYGRQGFLTRLLGHDRRQPAVDGVTLSVRRGETLGLVGESGCGKSTLARAMLRLVEPAAGRIRFDGTDIATLSGAELMRFRSRAQMVFQDPYGSLNPRMTARETLDEVLRVHGMADAAARAARIEALVDMVGLTTDLLDRRPRALSGGQCQRIGIARALAVEPELIVADEAIAALDLSIQAQILDLLRDLQKRLGLTIVFITHNLAVVRHLCDRVAVMNRGRIVEEGTAASVMEAPRDPYTRTLIAAMPRIAGPAAA